MAQVFTAKQTAALVSAKVGRKVDAKRVRAWVRDNVAAYDDEGYTAHQYDARLRDRIVAGMTAKAQTGRASAASKGREGKVKATAPKVKVTPKATGQRGRVSASQPGGTLASDAAPKA